MLLRASCDVFRFHVLAICFVLYAVCWFMEECCCLLCDIVRVAVTPPWDNVEVDLLLAMTRPKVLERILQVNPVACAATVRAAGLLAPADTVASGFPVHADKGKEAICVPIWFAAAASCSSMPLCILTSKKTSTHSGILRNDAAAQKAGLAAYFNHGAGSVGACVCVYIYMYTYMLRAHNMT